MTTNLPESALEKKEDELYNLAVRTTIKGALHAMAVWAFARGREQGLKEAKEQEENI